MADRVAAHLLSAGLLLDEDPVQALEQTRAARDLAGRVAVVREATGIAAYRAGEFAEARTELRTARRLSGSSEHLPLLADCERALGHPERALEVARDPQAGRLDRAARVELDIVVSGARRDLGQVDAAVVALEGRDLEDPAVHPWTVRLWYAYAEALLAAGRTENARRWFAAAATIDDEDETDAADRVLRLDEAPPG